MAYTVMARLVAGLARLQVNAATTYVVMACVGRGACMALAVARLARLGSGGAGGEWRRAEQHFDDFWAALLALYGP